MNTHKTFAKVFETEKGQIVAMLGSDDDDRPEIRFFIQPFGLGICQLALCWVNSDAGEAAAKHHFENMDAERAIAITKEAFEKAESLTTEYRESC